MSEPQVVEVGSAAWIMLQEERERSLAERLHGGGGGGTSGGMETRITRLEAHVEVMQRDVAELKTDMRTMIDIVRDLPTKSDLTTFRWQWVATSVAAIALIVGGIIGGLSWIKPDAPTPVVAAPAAPVPPIVIQVPTPTDRASGR